MSSIIVFNLPKNVTKNDLRESFGFIGNVINVQLIFTVDREYCYFALITYETENEAKDALNFFDKSYIYSSRIKVERCCEIENNNEVILNVEEISLNDEVNYNKKIENTSQILSSNDLENLPDEEGQLSTTDVTEKKVYSIPLLLLFGSREAFCQKDHDYMFRNCEKIFKNQKNTFAQISSSIQSILDGITSQNVVLSIERFKALPIYDTDTLEKVVAQVFKKAMKPNFAYYAASLTAAMQPVQMTYINVRGSKTVSFQSIMVEKCHTLYELHKIQEIDFANNLIAIKECKDSKEVKILKHKHKEIEKELLKNTQQILGNCRFIGELFKQQIILPITLVYYIINLVIGPHHISRETPMECVYNLIKTTGKELEQHYKIDDIFNEINNLKNVSIKMKYMIKDLKYLRRNNWIPPHETVKINN